MLTDTLVFLSTGAEAERSDIPSAVPVEDVAPETQEAAIEASEPMEVAAGEAATMTRGEEAATLPEPTLEVVVRSPEIQDAEPIRSAPMTEAATSSRGGSSCWRMIWSIRQRWLGIWRRSARPSNG
jgi:hypothetical protein